MPHTLLTLIRFAVQELGDADIGRTVIIKSTAISGIRFFMTEAPSYFRICSSGMAGGFDDDTLQIHAGVAELADAPPSKSGGHKAANEGSCPLNFSQEFLAHVDLVVAPT